MESHGGPARAVSANAARTARVAARWRRTRTAPHRAAMRSPLRAIGTRALPLLALLVTALPLSLPAQGGARPARRLAVDSTCLTGRACRLAVVDLDDGRRGAPRGLMLTRGAGRDAYVLGPAWERIAVSVGADPGAYAIAREALDARNRVPRRVLAVAAISMGTAAIAGVLFMRNNDFGLLTPLYTPLVAAPVAFATGLVLMPWVEAAQHEADTRLYDAVSAWNDRVDPRVP